MSSNRKNNTKKAEKPIEIGDFRPLPLPHIFETTTLVPSKLCHVPPPSELFYDEPEDAEFYIEAIKSVSFMTANFQNIVLFQLDETFDYIASDNMIVHHTLDTDEIFVEFRPRILPSEDNEIIFDPDSYNDHENLFLILEQSHVNGMNIDHDGMILHMKNRIIFFNFLNTLIMDDDLGLLQPGEDHGGDFKNVDEENLPEFYKTRLNTAYTTSKEEDDDFLLQSATTAPISSIREFKAKALLATAQPIAHHMDQIAQALKEEGFDVYVPEENQAHRNHSYSIN